LWRQAEAPPVILAKIEQVAKLDAAMSQAYDLWLNPPPPSAQQLAHDLKMKKLGDEAEVQRALRDKAWLEFVEGLRENPEQLRTIKAPSAEGVDVRIFHLWSLLSDTVDASTRYAIHTVAPVEPMLGADLAAELRDALIRHWRLWEPTLKSTKTAEERNRIFSSDSMGIAGISLEASANPGWVARISSAEATRAAAYATLELNGFPPWLSALAAAKPAEVNDLLIGEVVAELDDPEPRQRYDLLEDLSRADLSVVELITPALLAELERRGDIAPRALEPGLEVIRRGPRPGCRIRARPVRRRRRSPYRRPLSGSCLCRRRGSGDGNVNQPA
jgi:hypothetical protein